jgi:transcriptional regulator with XRE-family HTH domain
MSKTRRRKAKKKPSRKASPKGGRMSAHRELLSTVKSVMNLSVAELAEMIGKAEANVSAYLTGNKEPGVRVIRSALQHLAEWTVAEDQIMLPIARLSEISTHPGIYFMYDSAGNCLYLGQATNLKTEVAARLKTKKLRHGIWRDPTLKLVQYKLQDVATFVSAYRVDSPRLRHNLEALFLRTVINQTQNAKLGVFK